MTEPNHRLNVRELTLLIEKLCTVDGQAPGTTRPHADSQMGQVLIKLERQLELLK